MNIVLIIAFGILFYFYLQGIGESKEPPRVIFTPSKK